MLLKAVMAVTGAILVLYLVAHMIGNLKIFFGAAAIDHYSAWLRTILEPVLPHEGALWIIRVVLTVAVLGHIGSAILLARRAHRARPVRYEHRQPVQGSYAARTMRWGGVIIVLFVVFHILDLTTGTLNPNGVPGAVSDNIHATFGRWYVTLFYTLAMIAIGFHLRHGLWSAMQTLGWSNTRTQRALKTTALVISLVLTIGFLSVPFAVVTGLV